MRRSRGVGRAAGRRRLLAAIAAVAVVAAGCAARQDAVEIEVEETITTVSAGNSTTTIPRGPAPGWERKGGR